MQFVKQGAERGSEVFVVSIGRSPRRGHKKGAVPEGTAPCLLCAFLFEVRVRASHSAPGRERPICTQLDARGGSLDSTIEHAYVMDILRYYKLVCIDVDAHRAT
jgi:hypothetical protein